MKQILVLMLMVGLSSCALFDKKEEGSPDPAPTSTGNPGWIPAECTPDPSCRSDQCMCSVDNICHTPIKCHKRP